MYKIYKKDLLPSLHYVNQILVEISTAIVASLRLSNMDISVQEGVKQFARPIPIGIIDNITNDSKNVTNLVEEILTESFSNLRNLLDSTPRVPFVYYSYVKSPVFKKIFTFPTRLNDKPSIYKGQYNALNDSFEILYKTFLSLNNEITRIEESYNINEDEILVIEIKVSNKNDYDYSEITKELRDWNIIYRGFAALEGISDEMKIVSVERGSIILLLALGYKKIIDWTLKTWNSALDGKIKVNEIRETSFKLNSLLNDSLDGHIQKIIDISEQYPKDIAESMALAILSQYEEVPGDVATHARKSIELIIEKVFRGDKADFLLLERDADNSDLLSQLEKKEKEILTQDENYLQLDPDNKWELLLAEKNTEDEQTPTA